MDKDGERLCEKNIYANPFYLCRYWWTAMGLHCALNVEILSKGEKLFLAPGVKERAGAVWYQEQLMRLMK